jgi:hypothetical protein
MMEEEEPRAGGDAPAANVQPTTFMSSPVLPTQGQVSVNDYTVSTASGNRCSEPTFAADQAAPMDVEVDLQQHQALEQQQPKQRDPFFSG